jgi:serine/threonine protein kinase
MEQILSAVAYLQDRNIVQRDLKHENILFVNKDQIDLKLIDFDLCQALHSQGRQSVTGLQ